MKHLELGLEIGFYKKRLIPKVDHFAHRNFPFSFYTAPDSPPHIQVRIDTFEIHKQRILLLKGLKSMPRFFNEIKNDEKFHFLV